MPIVQYVYGSKWLPAVPALYLFYINMILGVGAGVLMPAIYSAGRAAIGFAISVTWTALTWLTAIALMTFGAGFVAIAAAYAVGAVLAFGLILLETRRFCGANLVGHLIRPIASGVLVGACLHLVAPLLIHDALSLVGLALLGAAAGLTANLWGDRFQILGGLRSAVSRTSVGSRYLTRW